MNPEAFTLSKYYNVRHLSLLRELHLGDLRESDVGTFCSVQHGAQH